VKLSFRAESPPSAGETESRNLKIRDVSPSLDITKSNTLICIYGYRLFTKNVKFMNNPGLKKLWLIFILKNILL